MVVASGGANEAKYDIQGYKYIVTVTWCKGHDSNPRWFPYMLTCIGKCINERFDLLGLSRGVQAVMLCFDSRHGCFESLASTVGNIVLAGGCIWQRQDRDLPVRILQNVALLHKIWERKPFCAVVVSEMDATVRKKGDVSKKKKNGYREDYGDFSEQVMPYTECSLVLESAGHADVCWKGILMMETLKRLKNCRTRKLTEEFKESAKKRLRQHAATSDSLDEAEAGDVPC